MKKLAFLIAALLLISLIPLQVFAAETREELIFNTDSFVSEDSQDKYMNGTVSGYPTNTADGSLKLRFALLKNAKVSGDVTVKPVIDAEYPFVAGNVIGKISGLTQQDAHFDFVFQLKDNVYNGVYPVRFTAEYSITEADALIGCIQEFTIYIRVAGKEQPALKTDAVNFDNAAKVGGSSYAEGYMPVLNKSNKYTALVEVPLKDLTKADGDILVSFVAGGSFKPSNAVETLSNANDKGIAIFEVQRASETYNGIYPAVFRAEYSLNGEKLSKDFTIYIQVADKAVPSVGGSVSATSQPRVMVTKYTLDSESAVAGEEFTLTLEITNQSNKTDVRNIKVTVSSGGEFVPADGTNALFINEIEKECTEEVSFRFKTMPDAAPRPASINVQIDYETPKVMTYSESAVLSIPVTQPIRLQIDAPVADTVEQGDTMGVSMKIYNLGKSPLYNVSASVRGEGIMAEENYYGGTIEAGGTKTIAMDIIVDPSLYSDMSAGNEPAVGGDEGIMMDDMAVMPREMYGGAMIDGVYGGSETKQIFGVLVLTYEDADGNIYTEERDFAGGVNVYQEYIEPDMPVFEEDIMMEEPKQPTNWWLIGGIAAGVLAIGGIIFGIIRRNKRKKEIEDALS
ncbi:MAG: hypothetical protein E7332_05550 [Clostridiales bacterium]|nr:hypothetical protein [Clostridiales bacterium]